MTNDTARSRTWPRSLCVAFEPGTQSVESTSTMTFLWAQDSAVDHVRFWPEFVEYNARPCFQRILWLRRACWFTVQMAAEVLRLGVPFQLGAAGERL